MKMCLYVFTEIPLPSTPSKQVTHSTVETRESKHELLWLQLPDNDYL